MLLADVAALDYGVVHPWMTLDTILLLGIGGLQGAIGLSFLWGQWTKGREAEDATLARRLDRAEADWREWRRAKGQELSDLSDKIQSEELRLRKDLLNEFMTEKRCDDRMIGWNKHSGSD